MYVHKHCVWPTRAPPVCTAYWDTESWERFEDGFRPEGYTGDRHDTEAWERFDAERRAAVHDELRVAMAAQISRHMGQEAGEKWLAAAREGKRRVD